MGCLMEGVTDCLSWLTTELGENELMDESERWSDELTD